MAKRQTYLKIIPYSFSSKFLVVCMNAEKEKKISNEESSDNVNKSWFKKTVDYAIDVGKTFARQFVIATAIYSSLYVINLNYKIPYINNIFSTEKQVVMKKPTNKYIDRQYWVDFNKTDFKKLSVEINAAKTEHKTAWMVNGTTNKGEWYQFVLEYNPKMNKFKYAVQIWNSAGKTIFQNSYEPSSSIKEGDKIKLTMSIIDNKKVVMVGYNENQNNREMLSFPTNGSYFEHGKRSTGMTSGIMQETYYSYSPKNIKLIESTFTTKQNFILPHYEVNNKIIVKADVALLKYGDFNTVKWLTPKKTLAYFDNSTVANWNGKKVISVGKWK